MRLVVQVMTKISTFVISIMRGSVSTICMLYFNRGVYVHGAQELFNIFAMHVLDKSELTK